MSDFTIEKVFVHKPLEVKRPLIGYARIQIAGGLFISELRIYEDSEDPNLLYISFPTRIDTKGVHKKVAYPISGTARKRITQAITKEYLKEVSNGK